MVVEWGGELFALIDTGGVDAGDDGPFQSEIVRQAELAISEADLVLLLVDATTSPGAADLELAQRLRRSHVPVLLVANKLDNPRRHDLALEYHELGSVSRSRSRRCTASPRATCSTRSSRACARWTRRTSSARRTRSASPSSAARTSASRRS